MGTEANSLIDDTVGVEHVAMVNIAYLWSLWRANQS